MGNLNFKLQKKHLSANLKKRGIEPDLIDLDAHIDRSLSFRENKTIIQQKTKGLGVPQTKSFKRVSSAELTLKANRIQEKRSYRSQAQDARKKAQNTFYYEDLTPKEFKKWKKNPNRYDIKGVD